MTPGNLRRFLSLLLKWALMPDRAGSNPGSRAHTVTAGPAASVRHILTDTEREGDTPLGATAGGEGVVMPGAWGAGVAEPQLDLL